MQIRPYDLKNQNFINKNNKISNSDPLKGVLLNNYIKNQTKNSSNDFSKLSTDLLIYENEKKIEKRDSSLKENKETDNVPTSFNIKNVLKPISIASISTLIGLGLISLGTKNYSKVLANEKGVVRPGDLARNINILEEPHFAMYRLLRDPNAKNVFGFLMVGLMSGVTLCAKNLVDGYKEIWEKKEHFKIEHDLEKDLIDVESKVFKGKLDFINQTLVDTNNYFKKELKTKSNPFLGFKGNKEDNSKENKEAKEAKNNSINKIKLISLLTFGLGGFTILSYSIFKNYQKTIKNLDTFKKKFEDKEIVSRLFNAVNEKDKDKAINETKNILKSINAKDDTINHYLSQIKGINSEEIKDITKEIKSSQIYASAPEALGGISEKIQYYCYMNEERGHLYNWILNPENKFNKYLFLSFTMISSIGYIVKSSTDAIKNILVEKENSKSELDFRKKMVEVEINNFKAKKICSINPLIEKFNKRKKENASLDELNEIIELTLSEIKNGPPYLYD